MSQKKLVMLVIMDGFGIRKETDGNAIAAARNIAERLDGADVNRALCKLSGAGLFCINVRAARKKVKVVAHIIKRNEQQKLRNHHKQREKPFYALYNGVNELAYDVCRGGGH